MNVLSVELAISVITLVVAYFIVTTLAGSFRAWIAYSFGDDTAESLGLMSLNPLVHADLIGMFFLLYLGFGWGKRVPVNPFKIRGPYRMSKIVFAYLSDTFAHLSMAFIFFSALIYFFGLRVINLAIPMIYFGRLMQSQFAQFYPDSSSLAISLGLICIALIFFNVLLAVLNFILNVFNLLVYAFFYDSFSYSRYRDVLMFVIPIFFIYFFIGPLRFLVIKFLYKLGVLFAQLFNVL